MRRFWGWLGLNLGRRAGIVAMTGLLVTLVFGLGVTKLRFTTTNADYLNRNDPAWLANVAYEKSFGGDPMAVMFTMKPGYTVDDFFTSANQAEMKTVAAKLDADPWVYSHVTPLDAMSISQVLLSVPPGGTILDTPAAQMLENAVKRDPSAASRAKRSSYLLKEGELESAFTPEEQVMSNPKWMDFLLHEPDGHIRAAVGTFVPNDHHTLLPIYLKGNISVNQESTAANSVYKILDAAHWQHATALTTGVPELIVTINNYLKHGILLLAGVAALLMLSILALSFNVRWRFLAFAIVAVGSIWAFGLVGFFGIPLTLATIAALPTLLGIGMDYAIQMHSRIEEEVVLDRSPHPVQAAARGLGPALLVVTFDAVFSFMAMWFAKTPAIREFGSLLVVGIVAICVCSIILTLATLGIREYKSPTKGRDFSHGYLSRGVAFLGSTPKSLAIPLAVASVFVFLGGIVVEGHLHIQTDAISWVNPHSKAIEDIEALKAGTGSANEIAVNLRTDTPFSDQTVKYVIDIADRLETKYHGVLLPATGIINTLDQVMNNVPGTTEVYPTGSQIEGLYLLSTPGIRRTTMANNGHSVNIIFRAYPDTLSSLEPVVKDLQGGITPPSGFTLAPGGIAIVGVGLIENIEKSRVQLTYLAVLFVGAFLAVRLRSLVRALLSLVPVLTAVGAVSLVAVAFNLKLSPVTAVAGPLVVAVCTEFTSLILLRFVEERQRGYPPRRAMDATARRTGRAFVVSGATAVAGIGTLATSSMPLLSDFGTIVALNVTVALVSALVVLPPILVAAEERGWVTRGLLYKEEVPFIEYGIAAAVAAGGPPVPVPVPETLSAMAWTPPPPSPDGWPAPREPAEEPVVSVPAWSAGEPVASTPAWSAEEPVATGWPADEQVASAPGWRALDPLASAPGWPARDAAVGAGGWAPPDERTAAPPGLAPPTVPVRAWATEPVLGRDNGEPGHAYAAGEPPTAYPAGDAANAYVAGHPADPYVELETASQYVAGRTVNPYVAGQPADVYVASDPAQTYEVVSNFAPPVQRPRAKSRSARLAAIAARLVGIDDR